MIENLFTFVRTLGNQRIQGKKFFVTQVGLLGTVSDNSGSIGTAGKVLSSTGSGVSWITVGSGNSNVATLNDLTDVVISTAVEGNLLRFNGTSWVNWAPNFLTGYGSLNNLSDVTLTTPVNGARLIYSSTTSQWIDANPLDVNKIYYGTASGDAATTTVITNGTRLGVGSLAMPTNLTVGQVDITTGFIGDGSIHVGGVNDDEIYLLASKNKIQVGSQAVTFIPGEGGEDPGTTITTFTPSILNIQPLGGDTVFGGYTTATGYKTPAGNRQELLTAAGTKTLTNSANNGQILRWIQPVGGVGNWQADDENSVSTPSLDAVTDVGSTTTNSITVGGLSTSGTVTAAVVTAPLIEREGVLTINSEEQVDQGEPNPNLLYVSWMGDNKFVINADGYAIATTGYKVVGGTASGFLKANGTIDTSTYLTSYTETQTLDAVTDLGSTTTNNISVGGLTSTSVSTPILQSNSGILIIDADVNGGIQPQQGDPAEPILSFDWQGNTQGYIDTDGKITFQGFKTPTGTASGFLKANGTVDTSVYLTAMGNLDDIGDVTLTSAEGGDVLMFDGEEWVNAPLPDYASKVQHIVKAGVAITKGQAVYVTSANGTNMIVGLASNATEATSSKTMGLALSTAAINDHIFVVTEGLIAGLNTSTATVGNPVWLGVNGALIFGIANKPVAPAHLVYIGVVTRVSANNGEIFVHIQNGFELNEIHDVLINGVATGDLIRREADGLWKNWSPNYITANSVDTLLNKTIPLGTGIATIVAIDDISSFAGQGEIPIYQYGIDKGGTIIIDGELTISIANPGIGYFPGPVNTSGGTTFVITVNGNVLTGSLAEFNEAITDGNLVTEAYVQSQIANLVDSAPATLDTLNELAAALGDDANFSTTVATSIGTKQNQLNGTGFVKASGTTISYDNSVYLTSETDPVFKLSPAYGITSENITNWDTAYGWGDHSIVGYLTTLPAHNHDDRYFTETESDARFYLATNPSGYQTTSGTVAMIASGVISNLNAAWKEPGLSIANGFVVYRYGSSSTNQPVVADNANWLINIYSHPAEGEASYGHQLAAANGNDIYFRSVSNGAFSGWHKFWSTNDFGTATIDNWNAGYNNSITAASFATATGILTLTQQDLGTVTVNLDGRYLTAASDSQQLSYDSGANELSISNGNSITLDGLATEAFVTSQGYITGYTEVDTLSSVTGRGATTSNLITINSSDVGLKVQENGTSTAWRGRIGSFNSTADKSSFLGNYTGRAGVFGHNNALTAWDDLWVNTLGIYGQGNLYLSWNTYVKGNSTDTNYSIWHEGNDGDGSGLDADSVDGVHASNIVWGNAKGTNDSVTTDADGLDKTGFYTSSGFVTRPQGVDNWMYIQHIKLYNNNSEYQKQIGYDTYDDSMWVRTKAGNTWSTWKPILTSENIGSYALTSLPAHTHTIAEVTGLQTALDGKAASSHTHAASDITSGTLSTDRLPKQELGISIAGNFGQWEPHGTYTNFNTDVAYWGWSYVQGNGNAPHATSSQWYRGRFSLGSQYGLGSGGGDYWMEIAIPRYSQGNNAGNLFVRTAEDGVPTAWQGVRGAYSTNAGYAVSSGNSETTDQTNFTALSIDNLAVATEEFVTSQGYTTGSYLPLSGGTLSGNLTFSTQGSKITFGDSTSTNPCMIGEGLVNTEGTDSDFLTIYARSSLRIYSTVTTERARFDINGLTVNGTITEQSSIRYKKDVVGIESISDRVELLKPVRYKKIENEVEEIGLIAEDVAELFPEVVKYDNEGRPDGVNYSRLSVILLKAVQELTERVNKLENK